MITSLWEDIKEALYPVAYAEEDEKTENKAAEKAGEADEPGADDNESSEKSEDDESEEASEEPAESEDAEESGDDDEEDEDDDEDDEDEDEDAVKDPLDTLREKYTAGVCHDFKHHFDECTERVTAAMEQDDYEEHHYKEDCVEEFFHLQHCLDDNTAKTLFSKLR